MFSPIIDPQELAKAMSYPRTVMYFYLTDCPSCKKMGPVFQEVASASELWNQEILFATINVEENRSMILNQLGEKSSTFPLTVVYHSGREVGRVIGRKEREEFEKWVKSVSISGDPENEMEGKSGGISDGPACTGIFEDRKPKRLVSKLLGSGNKPFNDPEPECVIRPTPNLKGAQIGRANDGTSYFSIRLWHEPGDDPEKIFFGLDFMPDPAKERFQTARFEVSFSRDDPQGQHPPLKILDMDPTSTTNLNNYDNRSISTFSASSLDLQETRNDTTTVVNGQGKLSSTAVWTFVEDESTEVKRGLDAHYTVSVTLPSVERVWMKFHAKAVLLGEERIGPWKKVTLQSGSLEAPYKRILDLSEC